MANQYILGIESSCDETAAAVVRDDGLILSDVVASQIKEHAPYGGIVPELASRAHLRAIVPVVQKALAEFEGGLERVDAIAVTQGPGLVGSLLVGLQVAKAMAYSANKPLIGVNHLDGHLLSVFLRKEDAPPVSLSFPFIALLASGGHSALYRVDAADTIALLGQTRDDAAGEAFDKAAKILGLGYPGGPIVDKLAAEGDANAIEFPIALPAKASLEFSFSGLKTSLARYVEKEGVHDEKHLRDIAASFQKALVEALVRKSIAACQREEIQSLVITGGVAANRGLRARAQEVAEKNEIKLVVPPFHSCTDNAAMIAYAAFAKLHADQTAAFSIDAYSRDPERRRGKFDREGKLIART